MLLGAVELHCPVQIDEGHGGGQIREGGQRLVHQVNFGDAAISGSVIVVNDADWLQALLGSKVVPARLEIVVNYMAEERGPVTIEHPVESHLVVAPAACSK